jgi:hypothetical protein
MRHLKALVVLALALVVAGPAFAETQNVKVSGSLDVYGFYRDNYDFNKDGGSSNGTAVAAPTGDSEADAFFRSNTQVEVSADLTDNVSTVINVINQRDWDGGATVSSADGTQFDIDLDLAYVQMKEIFYSPLTLTVGRQDIWFGRGFIIGNNNHAWDYNGETAADEYSVSTAFDALRATLDFNPWTIDFIYSKITEGNINLENDINLYGANVNYKFAEYNAVAEGYWFTEHDRANATDGSANQVGNSTHTIGARAQFDPIAQITLGAELAYQFGEYNGALGANQNRDRGAWAADVFGTYRWDNAWKPELTLEYVHFSGESDLSTSSEYGAWNGLYRGKFYTAIGDFRQFLYFTDDTADQSATQNQNLFQVKGGLKPLEDLLLEASFTYFWVAETIAGRSDEIGWEVDTQVTYDYTEDVSFGLVAAWFNPGDFYTSPNDETATDLVSSVKVTF